MRRLIAAVGLAAAAAAALLTVLQGAPGLPLLLAGGTRWDPPQAFGLLPGLVGSLLSVLFAMALCARPARTLALVMALGGRAGRVVRMAALWLQAVPSVVIGLLGLYALVPFLRSAFGGSGFGIVAAAGVLAAMGCAQLALLEGEALALAPKAPLGGALALGASHARALIDVGLPCVRDELRSARLLTAARLLAETMAVQMVVGNAPAFRLVPLGPAATLTTQVASDIGGAPPGSPWWHALWALALVLLGLSFTLSLCARRLRHAA